MEITETGGRMSGHSSHCGRSGHGKEKTENQWTNKKHHPEGIVYIKKWRWNKKRGRAEKSKKHSKVLDFDLW